MLEPVLDEAFILESRRREASFVLERRGTVFFVGELACVLELALISRWRNSEANYTWWVRPYKGGRRLK